MSDINELIKTVRVRIQQLTEQKKHGETLKANVTNDVLIVTGALNEAGELLKWLVKVSEDEKAATEAAKAAEAAKKAAKVRKPRKSTTSRAKVALVENTTEDAA